jgi:hypothetical protein
MQEAKQTSGLLACEASMQLCFAAMLLFLSPKAFYRLRRA